MPVRIGIIEDDAGLREGLCLAFEMEGYSCVCASTLKEGRRILEAGQCDLAVLDCSFPDGNGLDLVKWFRTFSSLPILMLTARSGELDEIQALELGVDDFMKKPFSLAVLKTRVKKLLRKKTDSEWIISGSIALNTKNGEVQCHGEKITLSATEFRLLLFFLEHREQILSKEQLFENIWDQDMNYVDENTLAVAIRRLRIKIEENPSSPKHIRTVHGRGYIWQEE